MPKIFQAFPITSRKLKHQKELPERENFQPTKPDRHSKVHQVEILTNLKAAKTAMPIRWRHQRQAQLYSLLNKQKFYFTKTSRVILQSPVNAATYWFLLFVSSMSFITKLWLIFSQSANFTTFWTLLILTWLVSIVALFHLKTLNCLNKMNFIYLTEFFTFCEWCVNGM